MRKVQFGCGGNRLDGWENHDLEWPIDKPIPIRSETVNFILAEHVVEHVDCLGALAFFHSCHRILVTGGVLRVAVPSITSVALIPGALYDVIIARKLGRQDYTRRASLLSVIQDWGHRSWWNSGILHAVLLAVGFDHVVECAYGRSEHPELAGVDGHLSEYEDEQEWSVMRMETVTMEATK